MMSKEYRFSHKLSKVLGVALTMIICLLFLHPKINAAEGELQLGQLRTAIINAKKELEEERKRFAEEEERLNGLVQKLSSERDRLSDSVIDHKISTKRKREVISEQQVNVNSLKDDLSKKEETWNQIATLINASTGELNRLLKTLPPSGSRYYQKEELNRLKDKLISGDEEISVADVKSLFRIVVTAIKEGQDIELFSDMIRTEQGMLEKSYILRIGHIATVYESLNNKKVGLLIKGIEGQEGFRWKEDLSRYQRKKIIDLFDVAKNNRRGNFLFPVDVTQEIHPEVNQGNSGLFAVLSSGGLVMIPLACVALAAILLIVERLLFLKKERSIQSHLMEKVVSLCEKGDYAGAEDICRKQKCPITRTIAACLSMRKHGATAMEDSVQESIMHELPRVERFLPAIGVLATVAPLLGLLGTVTGMINTFHMITIFGSGNAGLMAGGISEALVTTATGLVIAIPVLLMHNYLSTKVDGIICDIERYAATVFNALVIQSSNVTKGG